MRPYSLPLPTRRAEATAFGAAAARAGEPSKIADQRDRDATIATGGKRGRPQP